MILRKLMIMLLVFLSSTAFSVEQSSDVSELRKNVEIKKQEYDRAKKAYEEAKASLESALKSADKDEVPCTCVFNKNRAWNPEKVIWRDVCWECANYRDDGTCSKVRKVEGAVVE
ncbi:hypothetical protein P6A00_004506 [Vibrio parahaemolyticus]|uniref:Uncharacterized protein n=1 Tax=Vibrio parahaemolyticus TaxID=670 RepID=A0A9Q3UKG2_VIBPH|nr:hypothetical protein [Vibrio parahaemolyticus]EGQ7800808.1 hypothetical protein [Vibrio parahaemolyticus]EGQ8112908.1 hypothetical protein [Vibrio parahaemolyticus]EGQ8200638.1 hypothetical protein [Vibrio parahaemolyticus]EGQ8551331.1 hypothetical protein [Vibrio parahaemolyticus]EGQ9074910.1 hypothetical protein [Vibrio parahaemolyticus]